MMNGKQERERVLLFPIVYGDQEALNIYNRFLKPQS